MSFLIQIRVIDIINNKVGGIKMERYVIVCAIGSSALKFHEKLTSSVCYKFNKRRTKLPAHFTIKAPLDKIPWMSFKSNEGKNKIIHCTVVSKKIKDNFMDIWNYVCRYPFDFNEYFDNISLYHWKNNTWVLLKKYKLI